MKDLETSVHSTLVFTCNLTAPGKKPRVPGMPRDEILDRPKSTLVFVPEAQVVPPTPNVFLKMQKHMKYTFIEMGAKIVYRVARPFTTYSPSSSSPQSQIPAGWTPKQFDFYFVKCGVLPAEL